MAMSAAKWASAIAVWAAVMSSGCAGEQEALIVVNSPGWQGIDCIADPEAPDPLPQGLVDVSFNTAYTLPVALLNNLGSRPGTTTSTGIENGELQLRDVDVTLSMSQAPGVISQVAAANSANVEFSAVLSSISLPPGETRGALVDVLPQGASSAFRTAIESNLGADARPILEATVEFHALRTGNSAGRVGVIDARAYTFPIEVCIGCVIPDCSGCPDSQCPPNTPFAGICGNAQDGPVWPITCDAPVD